MRKARTALLIALIVSLAGSQCVAAEPSNGPTPAAEAQSATPNKAKVPEGTPAVIVDDDKVESLLGKVVSISSGDKLGPVTDVLIGHGGDIRAAVVDFGGFLGVGTRKVAVAWSALKFSKDAITLDMTRDQLRVTPEYREHEPIVVVGDAKASSAAK